MTDEISKVADDLEALLPLFVESNMLGMFLPTQHAARFKVLAIEAKELVEERLGPLNNYERPGTFLTDWTGNIPDTNGAHL